jgi:hypothetical protein
MSKRTDKKSWAGHCGLWMAMALAAITLITAGCGRGPTLGTVTGTVTLDSEPLSGASVEFQPEERAPSYGTTNAEGEYELAFSREYKGAVPGMHTVRITPAEEENEEGEVIQSDVKIPTKYGGVDSPLTFKVTTGRNTADFSLVSE